ncbi:MAG: hypothetical protein JWL64_890 [Frankiales bacterium]|nr:hypothetical protein [Frankiales bacterium]
MAQQSRNDDEPPDRGRERREAQLKLIIDAYAASDEEERLAGVEVARAGDHPEGDIDFVYRRGRILVRDADLPRVQAILPGRVLDPHINGLTVYTPDLPVLEALDLVDNTLGKGIATPDHVLWVTVQSFCPAVEPSVPPPGTTDPVPGPAGVDCVDCDGEGVRVSVVDTGWWPPAESRHPWLAGVTGDVEQPFDANTGTIRPYGGHGTFAAGVVRATAPKASVNVEGVLPLAGAWSEADIVRQLYDALADHPDIVTVQAGTTTRDAGQLLAFQVLYETRLRFMPGTVLLAAAGNDATFRPFWPAAFGWATAVGALDESETRRTSWTNYGAWVDVYARGENLVNAFVDGTYVTTEPQTPAGETRVFDGMAVWSGTSFSTPYVAGLVASRMSRTGEDAVEATAALKTLARRHSIPKVGPVVKAWMACPGPDDPSADPCCCGDHGHQPTAR